MEKNRITKKFTEDYMNALEQPMFRDGRDLDDLIESGIIRFTDTTPESLHGNDES
jgi:hypothetical protein